MVTASKRLGFEQEERLATEYAEWSSEMPFADRHKKNQEFWLRVARILLIARDEGFVRLRSEVETTEAELNTWRDNARFETARAVAAERERDAQKKAGMEEYHRAEQARERALDEVREKLLGIAHEVEDRGHAIKSRESARWLYAEAAAIREATDAALDTLAENKPQDRDRGGL